MKQYVIDDLRAAEMERLKTWCAANLKPSCFNDVFWLNLDEAVLSETQRAHKNCRPFYLSLFLDYDRGCVVIDMAVRTARSMHCECMDFLSVEQFAWLDNTITAVFAELNIKL